MSDEYSADYDERRETVRERIVLVLSVPVDLVRPIAPRDWGWAARNLAAAPGWTPPMMLIAAMGTVAFSHGLLGQFAFLHVPHLVTLGTVSVIAMYFVARRASLVFPRYGTSGFTRPRWWFELGRVLWIVCIVAGAIAVGTGFGAAGLLRPVGDVIFRALMLVAAYAFAAFLAVSTLGYLLSFMQRLPRRGKAFECVQFFYGIILACMAGTLPVVLFRADRFALFALAISGIAATVAAAIALVQWIRKRRKEQTQAG
jgi:hypothetical protein